MGLLIVVLVSVEIGTPVATLLASAVTWATRVRAVVTLALVVKMVIQIVRLVHKRCT
jgi:hypothetical protein